MTPKFVFPGLTVLSHPQTTDLNFQLPTQHLHLRSNKHQTLQDPNRTLDFSPKTVLPLVFSFSVDDTINQPVAQTKNLGIIFDILTCSLSQF